MAIGILEFQLEGRGILKGNELGVGGWNDVCYQGSEDRKPRGFTLDL